MAVAQPASAAAKQPGRLQKAWKSISIVFESRVATAGISVVLFWVLIGLVSLVWTPHAPNASDFQQNLSPNSTNWLGTDHLGRDTASRLMTGTQVILLKTRLPETTASSYLIFGGIIAGVVSLGGLFATLGSWLEERRRRKLLALFAGLVVAIVVLLLVLPDSIQWLGIVAPLAAVYLGFLAYGWIKAGEFDLSSTLRTQSISAAVAAALIALSLLIPETVIPGFSIPIGVAIWGVFGSLVFGSILGLNAGYRGGWWDQTISQALDALIAFPVIVLYLVVIAALGRGDHVVILAITVTGTPGVARLVRSLTLDIKTRDYIRAAETRGESVNYIMFREILPNARGPILVDAMLRVGYAIFAIGTLGFLGIGLPPPDPDWGSMVNDARQFIFVTLWPVLSPAIAIASLVVGLNFFADGLREELTRYQK